MLQKSFRPGTNIVLEDYDLNLEPGYKSAKIKFPARIHMTPFDCNRFDFGKPGGGGYGFAINANNFIKVELADKDKIIAQNIQVPVIKHFVSIMKKTFGFNGNFNVSVVIDDIIKQHSGLGSTSIISCAVVWAFNVLFSQPLTKEQCRKIVTDNFAEGYNDELMRGLETGVGTHVAFHGGFVIMSDCAEEILSTQLPDEYKIVLVYCNCKRTDNDLPESVDMFNRSMELDSYYRYYKSYKVLMDLIPSIKKNDWKQVGDITWEFQFAGTHLSMIQGYNDKGITILDTMFKLKNLDPIAVGLSSVGPAIYTICEDSDKIVEVCKAENYLHKVIKVSNQGMIVEYCR